MRYATVADLISALQKMPQDAPVFGYSETDECDTRLEAVELYIPTKEDEEEMQAQIADENPWPTVYPPHYCQGDSYVSDYWRENKKVSPVVYVRESVWEDRKNARNGIRKENVLCIVDM